MSNIDLFHVDDVEISQPEGICIDELTPTQLENHPNANLLALDDAAEDVEVQIYSHLLRSNCPVTGQPDWGTVFIRYKGKKPCYNSILAYIISYRQHNGFHEQCVEQIFADIWQNLKPEKLMVYAAYTRRGGLQTLTLVVCQMCHGCPAQFDWRDNKIKNIEVNTRCHFLVLFHRLNFYRLFKLLSRRKTQVSLYIHFEIKQHYSSMMKLLMPF